MNHRFLTLASCFQGILFNGIESLFSIPQREPKIPKKYNLVRWLKRQGKDGIASVGLFSDANGNQFIIKHLQYRWKNLTYLQMINEVNLLILFEGWSYQAKSGRRVSFSALHEVVDDPGTLIFVKKYEAGETLEAASVETQVAIVTDCLEALRSIESKKLHLIGKRTAWQIISSFPFYWLRAIFKTQTHRGLMFRLLVSFLHHAVRTTGGGLVVTHRDLHSKNILVSGKNVFILDIESMVLCARETELALVSRFNHQHWGVDQIRRVLAAELDTEVSRRSFSALSIYYAVQMMVTDRITGPDYAQSINFLIQYETFLISTVL